MSINIIQAEYNKLDDIAGRFAKNAESTADMRSRIKQSVQALQNGRWEGDGSAAFFTEMERDVFPVVNKLSNALYEAQRVTSEICTIMQQAEEDAAAPFRSNATDNTVSKKETSNNDNTPNKPPTAWDKILAVADGIVDAVDQIDDFAPIPAAIVLSTMLKAGTTYGGQVLVYGPKWLKDLAGVSKNLTHIKATNMASHVINIPVVVNSLIAVAQGTVAVAKTWTTNWDEYTSFNDTSKHISAMTVDAGLALLPVATETLGGIGGTIGGAKLGAIVGTLIGGPGLGTAAGAIIGGAVGGFAGDWIGGHIGNWAKDGIISTGGRDWAVNSFDEHVAQPVADGIAYAADKLGDIKLPSLSLPKVNFSW